MDLYGFKIKVVFLVKDGEILAYAWHYKRQNAHRQLNRIIEYHGLHGEIKESQDYETLLKEKIADVVERGKSFPLPDFEYKNRVVYENIIKIPKGKTATYSEIAKASGINFTEMLITLMRNPLQVLIPCHRLMTKKRTLFGFHPLGKEVKKRLLEVEGAI